MFLGEQTGVGETVVVIFAEYDVVKNADAEDLRGFDQTVCAVAIFPRGSGLSRRMLCGVQDYAELPRAIRSMTCIHM
jgi:hypothetical protein